MSLPLEKLSDLTPRHTIDIERPWFSPEPNRQVALETLAEYFAENSPGLAAHIAETGADDVHGATADNTANMIVRRNADGTFTVSGVVLDTAAEPTDVTGMLRWNDQDKTAELVLENGVIIQIGQEQHIYARNTTGSTLAEGVAVRIVGASSNRPQIVAAQANSVANSEGTIGLITQSGGIANNAMGYVTTFGFVRGIDMSAFSEGDEVWLSPTVAGALTATRPTAEGQTVVRVGYVVTATNNGSIFVAPHFYGTTTGYAVAVATSASAARSAIGARGALIVADDTARFALTSATAPLGTVVQVTATGNNYIVVDTAELDNEDGYVVLPPAGPAKVVVRQGTAAEIAAVTLDSGEVAYATDTKDVYMGDGVTLGGVLWSRGSLIISSQRGAVMGASNGGTGLPGNPGNAGTLTLQVTMRPGDGGGNHTSGPANGGNGGNLTNSFFIIRGGAGGQASDGEGTGGNGGGVLGSLLISGGAGGSSPDIGSGPGTGGNGGTARGISISGGTGGKGGTNSNGGNGGAAGEVSGGVMSFVGGAGGDAGGPGFNGGVGGNSGQVQLGGGAGGAGGGAAAGAAGGRGSRIFGNGGAASGSTPGGQAGDITTSGNGTRAGGNINTSAGASHAGGSIDLSNGGNTLTIRGTAGQLGHRVAVPANSASAGLVGQWASDDSYLYVYGATGWRRLAASTF